MGAGHPVADNVSLWFYERGWQGLVAEPLTRLGAEIVGIDATARNVEVASCYESDAPAAPPSGDAIDLLDAAGAPVLKRALPVLAGLVVLLVLWRVLRRAR